MILQRSRFRRTLHTSARASFSVTRVVPAVSRVTPVTNVKPVARSPNRSHVYRNSNDNIQKTTLNIYNKSQESRFDSESAQQVGTQNFQQQIQDKVVENWNRNPQFNRETQNQQFQNSKDDNHKKKDAEPRVGKYNLPPEYLKLGPSAWREERGVFELSDYRNIQCYHGETANQEIQKHYKEQTNSNSVTQTSTTSESQYSSEIPKNLQTNTPLTRHDILHEALWVEESSTQLRVMNSTPAAYGEIVKNNRNNNLNADDSVKIRLDGYVNEDEHRFYMQDRYQETKKDLKRKKEREVEEREQDKIREQVIMEMIERGEIIKGSQEEEVIRQEMKKEDEELRNDKQLQNQIQVSGSESQHQQSANFRVDNRRINISSFFDKRAASGFARNQERDQGTLLLLTGSIRERGKKFSDLNTEPESEQNQNLSHIAAFMEESKSQRKLDTLESEDNDNKRPRILASGFLQDAYRTPGGNGEVFITLGRPASFNNQQQQPQSQFQTQGQNQSSQNQQTQQQFSYSDLRIGTKVTVDFQAPRGQWIREHKAVDKAPKGKWHERSNIEVYQQQESDQSQIPAEIQQKLDHEERWIKTRHQLNSNLDDHTDVSSINTTRINPLSEEDRFSSEFSSMEDIQSKWMPSRIVCPKLLQKVIGELTITNQDLKNQDQTQQYQPRFPSSRQPFNLNSSQLDAVKAILSSELSSFQNPTLVWGPPGTGKTLVIVCAIWKMLATLCKSKILVTAPSNASADLIWHELQEKLGIGNEGEMKGFMVRYNAVSRQQFLERNFASNTNTSFNGNNMRASNRSIVSSSAISGLDLHNDTAVLDERIRYDKLLDYSVCDANEIGAECRVVVSFANEIGAECRVVISTCSGAGSLALSSEKFKEASLLNSSQSDSENFNSASKIYTPFVPDLIFIDEAGQATESQSYVALSQNPKARCVLAGDHKQLNPLVWEMECLKLGVSRSLLERLVEERLGLEGINEVLESSKIDEKPEADKTTVTTTQSMSASQSEETTETLKSAENMKESIMIDSTANPDVGAESSDQSTAASEADSHSDSQVETSTSSQTTENKSESDAESKSTKSSKTKSKSKPSNNSVTQPLPRSRPFHERFNLKTHFLSTTYRPNSDILSLWSGPFYAGTVKLPDSNISNTITQTSAAAAQAAAGSATPDLNKITFSSSKCSVVFHDLSNEPTAIEKQEGIGGPGSNNNSNPNSYCNHREAEMVCEYILSQDLRDSSFLPHKDIGVIALYEKQVGLIQKKLLQYSTAAKYLGDIEVGTAEYFQGREKRVILISCVRTGETKNISNSEGNSNSSSSGSTSESSGMGFVGGKLGARRLNVALSRAKDGLVVLGSFRKCLAKDKTWMKVLKRAQKLGAIVQ